MDDPAAENRWSLLSSAARLYAAELHFVVPRWTRRGSVDPLLRPASGPGPSPEPDVERLIAPVRCRSLRALCCPPSPSIQRVSTSDAGLDEKRDYYEVLGVERNVEAVKPEERLPQGGAPVPPGSQSGQRPGRGASSRRPPRRTRSSRTPRSGRGTTASATRGTSSRASAGVPGASTSTTSSGRSSATSSAAAAPRRGGRQPAARTSATTWRSPSRRRPSAARCRSRSPSRKRCEACEGTRLQGQAAAHLPHLRRRRRAPLHPGLLRGRRAPATTAAAPGQMVADPCESAAARARCDERGQLSR